MIKTVKVVVEGERTSFYIEQQHKTVLLDVLQHLDCIDSPTNMDLPCLPVVRKIGDLCIRCNNPKRKNSKSKKYCGVCKKIMKEIRH